MSERSRCDPECMWTSGWGESEGGESFHQMMLVVTTLGTKSHIKGGDCFRCFYGQSTSLMAMHELALSLFANFRDFQL